MCFSLFPFFRSLFFIFIFQLLFVFLFSSTFLISSFLAFNNVSKLPFWFPFVVVGIGPSFSILGLALPPCTCARARRIDATAVFFWCAMCGTASEHGQCQCASVVTVHEPVHVKDLREKFFPSYCCCESNSPLPAAWRPRPGNWRQAQLNPHESPTHLCTGG